MRVTRALVLNLFVPGAGLIVLRREWLGLAAAALFALLGQIALLGLLLLPATIPPWLTTLGCAGAATVWLGAQFLLGARARALGGDAATEQIALLLQRADQTIASQAYAETEAILRLALAINDEEPTVNIRWAQLMTLMGRFRQARRAWRRVLSLDRTGVHRRTALEALAALPS